MICEKCLGLIQKLQKNAQVSVSLQLKGEGMSAYVYQYFLYRTNYRFGVNTAMYSNNIVYTQGSQL